jgi:hypothetical protein
VKQRSTLSTKSTNYCGRLRVLRNSAASLFGCQAVAKQHISRAAFVESLVSGMFVNLAKRLPAVTSRCARKYFPPSTEQTWLQLPSHHKWYSNSAPPPNQSSARDRTAVGVCPVTLHILFTTDGRKSRYSHQKQQLSLL